METNNIPKIKPEWLVGITMTSEQKAKWLEALRSGEYQQGKMALFKDGCFCCLGVLGVTMGVDPQQMMHVAWLDSVMGHQCPLGPNSIENQRSAQDVLSTMNDKGDSFAQIAQFIEESIPACDEVKS